MFKIKCNESDLKFLLCDADGVPELIQQIRFCWSDMSFRVRFFNGASFWFATDRVCPSINLTQGGASRMQMLEAENNITKLAEANWKKWFPSLRLVTQSLKQQQNLLGVVILRTR